MGVMVGGRRVGMGVTVGVLVANRIRFVSPATDAGVPFGLTGDSPDNPAPAGACTVTPGGSVPRTGGNPVSTGVSAPGSGVNVGRGVLVGVASLPEPPCSTFPTEQARLTSASSIKPAIARSMALRVGVREGANRLMSRS